MATKRSFFDPNGTSVYAFVVAIVRNRPALYLALASFVFLAMAIWH